MIPISWDFKSRIPFPSGEFPVKSNFAISLFGCSVAPAWPWGRCVDTQSGGGRLGSSTYMAKVPGPKLWRGGRLQPPYFYTPCRPPMRLCWCSSTTPRMARAVGTSRQWTAPSWLLPATSSGHGQLSNGHLWIPEFR